MKKVQRLVSPIYIIGIIPSGMKRGKKRYNLILYESVRNLKELNNIVLYKGYKVYKENPTVWGFYNLDNLEYNVNVELKKKQSNSILKEYKQIVKNKRKRLLLTFECQCGQIFNETVDDFQGNKYCCCYKCLRKKINNSKIKSKEHIAYLEKCGYKVLNKNLTYLSSDWIEVEDKDGYLGFVKSCGVHSGKGMSKFDIRSNKKHYIENVNNYIKINNLQLECIGFDEGDIKNNKKVLKFRCQCGNIFITSLASFQNGKVRCENCAKSISRYEYQFKKFLEEENIKYIFQYSLNQCRDVLPLPFDFYLVDYNTIIEIDGEGHFRPTYFNRISQGEAIKTFEITKFHDKIKNDFCETNHIPLLRIPYTMFIDNQYKKFFLQFIETVTSFG